MSDFNIQFDEQDQVITLEFEQIGGGAVKSVNGKTGVVVLDAEDVGAYTKPAGGIPKTDLASAVQTSLGKADSAYQKPSGGIPANDIASGVVPAVDNTLTVSGAAADAKKVGDEISTVKDGLSHIVGVPNTVRQAIADLLHSAAYTATGMTENLSIVDDWASVTATAIALSQYTIDFVGNGSQQLTAILSPPDSTDTVTWVSSDTAVATVTQNGLVTAVGNGTCTITASVGQLVATCAVTATGITVSYTITNTLTKAVNSNTNTVIAGGDPYSGTISGTTGYTVADADITVTMGGETVSGAVSEGVITIAEVTGNVVITAIGTLKGTNMMTTVTSSTWKISADTSITNASGGDFVATNLNNNGLTWGSNVIQQNLTVKSNELSGKTLFMEFDCEISGKTSDTDDVRFALSAFDRASPTSGNQRKGGYSCIASESGHYVCEIPVNETEIQLSSSYYFGLMVYFHGPQGYEIDVSNLVYTFY